MASTNQVYIAMYEAPWGFMKKSKKTRDCKVCLLMYTGTFTMEEFASKLLPLAKGELILFSEGSLIEPAMAWSGWATGFRLKCVSFSCCVLV